MPIAVDEGRLKALDRATKVLGELDERARGSAVPKVVARRHDAVGRRRSLRELDRDAGGIVGHEEVACALERVLPSEQLHGPDRRGKRLGEHGQRYDGEGGSSCPRPAWPAIDQPHEGEPAKQG